MDPNANLDEQRYIVDRFCDGSADPEQDGLRLAELVEALDDWIRKGGFLPKAWTEAKSGRVKES
jgi:hypothetical protein